MTDLYMSLHRGKNNIYQPSIRAFDIRTIDSGLTVKNATIHIEILQQDENPSCYHAQQ